MFLKHFRHEVTNLHNILDNEDDNGDNRVRDIIITRSLENDESKLLIDVDAVLRACKEEVWSISNENNDASQCPICLENLEVNARIFRLPCDHVFHRECIIPWIEGHHERCPVCRAQILTTNESLHHQSFVEEPINDMVNLPLTHDIPIITPTTPSSSSTRDFINSISDQNIYPQTTYVLDAHRHPHHLHHMTYDVPVIPSPQGTRVHNVLVTPSPQGIRVHNVPMIPSPQSIHVHDVLVTPGPPSRYAHDVSVFPNTLDRQIYDVPITPNTLGSHVHDFPSFRRDVIMRPNDRGSNLPILFPHSSNYTLNQNREDGSMTSNHPRLTYNHGRNRPTFFQNFSNHMPNVNTRDSSTTSNDILITMVNLETLFQKLHLMR